MSKCASSPTARLLQQSRLFSIPRSLPNADGRRDWVTGAILTASDTATAPYPTRQALETPLQSQSRGDWGLKRSLPRKLISKSGSPTVRVISQDTNDHVINFESANDHERSLAKFHEMSLPVLRTSRQPIDLSVRLGLDYENTVSVYEDSVDNTNPAQGKERWKFASPWIPGLEGYEMDAYMKQVNRRKPEWVSFIKEWHARSRLAQLKSELLEDRGFVGPFDCLDLHTQRSVLSNPKYFEALRANPAWMTGSLQSEPTTTDTAASDGSLNTKLAEIDRQLQRSKLADDFRRIDRVALDAMKHADEQAAATIKVDPQDESLANRVATHKEELRAQTFAKVDEACQQLLQARYGEDNKLVFTPKDISDSFEDRYAQVREIVAEMAHQDETRRTAQQAMHSQWLRATLDRLRPQDDEADAIIKALRDNHRQDPGSSQLAVLVGDFLGLPGSLSAESSATGAGRLSQQQSDLNRTIALELFNTRPVEGPPSTHPAAGISYLRSNSHMENHPVFGPQARNSPVMSRVVRTRHSWFGGTQQAKLGVGGFVTKDPKFGSSSDARKNLLALNDPDRMAAAMDASQEGGNKLWIEPTHATVDENGRVHISVLRADGEAVAVKTGQVKSILAAKQASLVGPQYSGPSTSRLPTRRNPGPEFRVLDGVGRTPTNSSEAKPSL